MQIIPLDNTMEVFDARKMGRLKIEEVARRITGGQVFIYPTDTVYGLGCDAMDESSIKRIFEIKGRDFKKPLSVAFCDMGQLKAYVDLGGLPKESLSYMENKLPGPYTFIVRNGKVPKSATGGLTTIGVRIPNYAQITEIIKKADTPIITTSANESGKPPAKSLSEIPDSVLNSVDFAIDAGSCGSGLPSKVIDLVSGRILRDGK